MLISALIQVRRGEYKYMSNRFDNTAADIFKIKLYIHKNCAVMKSVTKADFHEAHYYG